MKYITVLNAMMLVSGVNRKRGWRQYMRFRNWLIDHEAKQRAKIARLNSNLELADIANDYIRQRDEE